MIQTPPAYTLRPAEQNNIAFIFQLRQLTMQHYFAQSCGWQEADQYGYAAEHLDQTQLIMLNQTPIGCIKILAREQELHLHQLQLVPAFQNQGIGASLIQSLQQRAHEQSCPLTLFVLRNSPAKRLYDRLGFVIAQENRWNYRMIYTPASLLP